MINLNQTHINAVLQEFKYLIETSKRDLFFREDKDLTLRDFIDSD